ncbi:MAG: hypothetical protein PHO33_00485, partial [Clostridia bacterium]|nr:hypothetical protein [Clostridia bacterium]
ATNNEALIALWLYLQDSNTITFTMTDDDATNVVAIFITADNSQTDTITLNASNSPDLETLFDNLNIVIKGLYAGTAHMNSSYTGGVVQEIIVA